MHILYFCAFKAFNSQSNTYLVFFYLRNLKEVEYLKK